MWEVVEDGLGDPPSFRSEERGVSRVKEGLSCEAHLARSEIGSPVPEGVKSIIRDSRVSRPCPS